MKASRLVLVASLLLLAPWGAAESKTEEMHPQAPLILASSWSHCYSGSGSIVKVTLDSTTAAFYSSLTMVVDGNTNLIGTQSPSSTNAVTRSYVFTLSLAPGQHTFQLKSGPSGSPSYTFQVVSGGWCSKLPPAES